MKLWGDGLFEVTEMSANASRIPSDRFSTGEAQEMQKRGSQFSVLSSQWSVVSSRLSVGPFRSEEVLDGCGNTKVQASFNCAQLTPSSAQDDNSQEVTNLITRSSLLFFVRQEFSWVRYLK